MRRYVLFLPLVIFLGIGFFLWRGLSIDPTELPSARLNQPFPAFEKASLTNPEQTLTPDDLKGQVALVNIWATWCPTCKEEHAFLNQLAQQGVTIYGINYKDEPVKAREWLKRYLDPYDKVVLDVDGKLGLDLGVYGAPETYVIDADGVIRYRHVGAVDARVWKDLKAVMEQVSSGEGA
ncbi:DsbE family thiol:disulfide interchange protein [Marinobacterium mangrovicola]|uniref:Cytochrome c biogenesis protein CcmG/thiol:disulfide interchange protein DsbE n=1 Tax=Marinobacterium mangrovicola TaxID=1476959 RepID=A0A4R1GRF7_9GAMM|nr:DsbE family thiol:disulfide interchange protein [Marinobacterium mangrovicola]TCK07102.1 cytochrome c biogenesis protein CcmG/thiol:disulfide interchange protein DsbE [Marinobacterium mangrovicola]